MHSEQKFGRSCLKKISSPSPGLGPGFILKIILLNYKTCLTTVLTVQAMIKNKKLETSTTKKAVKKKQGSII